MSKKDQFFTQAKSLYTQQFLTFEDINKLLGISLRTLQRWAGQDNWAALRESNKQDFDAIASDSKKIAVLLGNNIKKILESGQEPSATILNAYSKLTTTLLNIKKVEITQDDDTPDKKDLAAKTFKEIFKNEL